jgi:quinol monooxygenase YgiN
MMLQASAEVPDYARFKAALEWLLANIEHPEGFVSLEVFQAADDPNRVTFFERWESPAAFQAAVAEYDMDQRGEFLQRAGIDPETFPRELWIESDIPVVRAGEHSGR